MSYDESKTKTAASTRQRAARLLAMRPMSTAELERKLLDKGESPDDVADALSRLTDLALLDDRKYAEDILQYCLRKGYGLARLKSEFIKRSIPEEYREELIETFMELGENNALNYITKKLRGSIPEPDELRRLSNALLRRGFSHDEIRSSIKQYIDEAEDNGG